MRFQLLIFDWDGTLADSVGHIVANMQAAITALKLPPRSDAQVGELIGLGFVDGLRRLFPEMDAGDVLKLLAEYRQNAPTGAFAAPLFPGAAEILDELRRDGFRLAVATGKTRTGLNRSLEHHPSLTSLFEFTRCADETADKPDPLMLREILSVSGVDAGNALMIGDTEYDIAMARAIGMPALGVATGVHDAGRMLRAGAMAVLEEVRAVPGWLRGVV